MKTQLAPPDVSPRLRELEAVIREGLDRFHDAAKALVAINEEQLYHERCFATFEDYCFFRREKARCRRAQSLGNADSAQMMELLDYIEIELERFLPSTPGPGPQQTSIVQ